MMNGYSLAKVQLIIAKDRKTGLHYPAFLR